jgi:hypothetical protein
LVRARAKEIAITNGRPADQFNEADLEQARQELEVAQRAPSESDEPDDQVALRDGPFNVSEGEMAQAKLPTDEQTLPEDLVAEGVEEAAHDQMVAGNQQSKRRDKHFTDQLPDSESAP